MAFTKDQDPDGSTIYRQQPRGGTEEFRVEFGGDPAVSAAVGRGTTDTDVVYLRLRNADGEVAYVFPNATQDGIVVQATRP